MLYLMNVIMKVSMCHQQTNYNINSSSMSLRRFLLKLPNVRVVTDWSWQFCKYVWLAWTCLSSGFKSMKLISNWLHLILIYLPVLSSLLYVWPPLAQHLLPPPATPLSISVVVEDQRQLQVSLLPKEQLFMTWTRVASTLQVTGEATG